MLVSFGGPAFPASALSGPDGAEMKGGPASEALRTILADPRATKLPQHGWRELYVEEQIAAFAAPDDGGWAAISLRRADDESWSFGGLRRGGPPHRYREGAGPAMWRFDPAQPRPTNDTLSVAVLVTELACTNGQRCDDRLLPAEVDIGRETVDVTFFVTSLPPGVYRCPSNPPCAVVVELPEPLGGRHLRDGCTFPPRSPDARWV